MPPSHQQKKSIMSKFKSRSEMSTSSVSPRSSKVWARGPFTWQIQLTTTWRLLLFHWISHRVQSVRHLDRVESRVSRVLPSLFPLKSAIRRLPRRQREGTKNSSSTAATKMTYWRLPFCSRRRLGLDALVNFKSVNGTPFATKRTKFIPILTKFQNQSSTASSNISKKSNN